MQGRPPPTGAPGMDMSNMPPQGLSMPPPMPSSPMTANPPNMAGGGGGGGDPMMMQPPPLQRGYSGGAPAMAPFAYTGSPMAAAPGTPSNQQQQQQRLLHLQIQQQQQQIMQLQQHQQQAVNMAASNDPSSQPQYQQLMPQQQQTQQSQQQQLGGPIAPPPTSPSTLKRPSDLPSPSDMLRLQRMQGSQQTKNQTGFHQRSGSVSSAAPVPPVYHTQDSGGSVTSFPQPPLYQRSQSTASAATSTGTSTSQSTPKSAAQQQLTAEIVQQLMSGCNAMDKTLYVAKRLLGGSTVNGFLRGTAAAQRIKKQRARQVAAGVKRDNPEAAEALKAKKKTIPEQQQEEELKSETMNVRTAKKIKTELLGGMSFCTNLHTIVVSILGELDPNGPKPPPLGSTSAPVPPNTSSSLPPLSAAPPKPLMTKKSSSSSSSLGRGASSNNPSSPGDPSGSTLRKLRKRKSTVQPSASLKQLEYDETGRRFSKKEHMRRIFEVLRFRALKQGDYVASRVSSRDLWILAVVVKDYSALDMADSEFLQLSEAKRNTLYRDKVSIKDAEDKEGGNTMSVTRNLVLPLPRNYAESHEWGARCKKGSRVYAMYPMTTSLYSATVIDSTTYCRGEDDIIVVEFDGDEADPLTGALPQYHIPARFVTVIPKEFPASQTSKKKRTSSTVLPPKRSSLDTKTKKSLKNSKHKRASSDDALNDMLNEMSYNAFPVDGDLGKFEQLEMGAFGTDMPHGSRGQNPQHQTSPMPPNPGLYRS